MVAVATARQFRPMTAKNKRGFIDFHGLYVHPRRLSVEVGLNYSYLLKIFKGQRVPERRTAQKLAEALGITTNDFYVLLEG